MPTLDINFTLKILVIINF